MPATYNGIGTHYYGQKKLEKRPGVCESCHRATELSSYDTRLWLVVFFLPVFPLRKKHILDYCPHCTRHRALDLAEWEGLAAKKLTEQMDKVKADPNDPQAAMDLCSALIAFGRHAEADQIMNRLQNTFPGDAKVLVFLGGTLDYLGRSAEAIPYYEQALKLNPELPEARVAVALDLVDKGKLEEARALLKFLDAPGQTRGVGALYALATAYQNAARHQEALELFSLITERAPAMAQDKNFRKAVLLSERALGQKTSTLPPRRHNWKSILGWSTAAVVALVTALGSNYYIANDRELHVINGYEQPITVEVPRHGSVVVPRAGHETLRLAEGRHRATIKGAVNQTVDFTLQSGFWARWFKTPVYVLNPGGQAILIWEQTGYSKDKAGEGQYTCQLHYGQPFVAFADVDYPFAEFPHSIKVDSRTSSTVFKTRVDHYRGRVDELIYSFLQRKDHVETLRLTEWHLRRHPEDTRWLPVYAYVARASNRAGQARDFLAAGVKRRPVEIAWHRIHQEMRLEELPAVVAEYEALLQAEPTNSALLYLRGRLAGKVSETRRYAERAVAADTNNAYAHYLLGSMRGSVGDWAVARDAFAAACAQAPEEEQFQQSFFETRLALAEFAPLDKELRAALVKEPLDLGIHQKLCHLCLVQDERAKADTLLADYEKQLLAKYPGQSRSVVDELRRFVLYAAGDFAGLEKATAQDRSPAGRATRFQALIETGQAAEAAKLFPLNDPEINEPFHFLTVSLAWRDAGRVEEATAWRRRALELCGQGRAEYRLMAELLDRRQPVPLAEALDVSLPPQPKAIFLLALAQEFPQQSAGYADALRKLNVHRLYPFHLLNRLAGKLPSH